MSPSEGASFRSVKNACFPEAFCYDQRRGYVRLTSDHVRNSKAEDFYVIDFLQYENSGKVGSHALSEKQQFFLGRCESPEEETYLCVTCCNHPFRQSPGFSRRLNRTDKKVCAAAQWHCRSRTSRRLNLLLKLWVFQNALDKDPALKIVVFAHHLAVLGGIENGLKSYHGIRIDGSTAPKLERICVINSRRTATVG